jgi:hypothetical protein
VVDAGDRKYVIELKRAAEGRRDRLVPLLSQAILQAQTASRQFSEMAVPVAVVAAARIPHSVAEQVKQFAIRYAPDVGIGVMDSEGYRMFLGFGLEALNAERPGPPRVELPAHDWSPLHLFTDLNQWMLKVLLSSNIPESLLTAPRGQYRSAAQLAQAAGVSVMSAARLGRQLSKEGFLDEREGWWRVVRIENLMQRWLAANQRSVREIPARWIIRGNKDQLSVAVQSYVLQVEAGPARPRRSPRGLLLRAAPRVCIGLFAAAEVLGLGFVQGVTPHIYLERPEANALRQLGLSADVAERHADVYVRIPKDNVTVFRPLVRRDGVPVSDILQVWLDVSNHPARGKEQADQIWRRVLARGFGKDE